MTTYFGNSSSGGATRTLAANTDYAETFQCTADGVASNGKAFLRGGGLGSTNVRFIVYNTQQIADSDPAGWSILGYSDTVVIGSADAPAWIDFNFTTQPSVANGTYYAIGIQADNQVILDASGTGGYFNGSDTFSDGPAATFPSGGSQSGANRKLSVQLGVDPVPTIYTDSATVTTVTTPSSSVSADYIEAQTISTSTSVQSTEALYNDLATITSLTDLSASSELTGFEYDDLAIILTKLTLFSLDIHINVFTDASTIRFVSIPSALESYIHPAGSWGPNDTDDGIFVWP